MRRDMHVLRVEQQMPAPVLARTLTKYSSSATRSQASERVAALAQRLTDVDAREKQRQQATLTAILTPMNRVAARGG